MNEKAFIDQLLRPLIRTTEAGDFRDDVALLRPSDAPQIITTDTLIEGRHFRIGDDWSSVAQKLIRVNISDCLAKGAVPEQCLLNLSWNSTFSQKDLEAFVSGLSKDLSFFGLSLIGGDTTSHEGPVVLSLTLIGRCVRSAGPVRRSGAKPGDMIWVSGTIGDSFLGLGLVSGPSEQEQCLNQRYLVPQVSDVAIADLIAAHASAAMDVSDGLIIDAAQLASVSEVRLTIRADDVPVSTESKWVIDIQNINRRDILNGGDDYQVLFTAPAKTSAEIEKYAEARNLQVTQIGWVESGEGVACLENGADIFETLMHGWEHRLSR